jgi:hypothetical protein
MSEAEAIRLADNALRSPTRLAQKRGLRRPMGDMSLDGSSRSGASSVTSRRSRSIISTRQEKVLFEKLNESLAVSVSSKNRLKKFQPKKNVLGGTGKMVHPTTLATPPAKRNTKRGVKNPRFFSSGGSLAIDLPGKVTPNVYAQSSHQESLSQCPSDEAEFCANTNDSASLGSHSSESSDEEMVSSFNERTTRCGGEKVTPWPKKVECDSDDSAFTKTCTARSLSQDESAFVELSTIEGKHSENRITRAGSEGSESDQDDAFVKLSTGEYSDAFEPLGFHEAKFAARNLGSPKKSETISCMSPRSQHPADNLITRAGSDVSDVSEITTFSVHQRRARHIPISTYSNIFSYDGSSLSTVENLKRDDGAFVSRANALLRFFESRFNNDKTEIILVPEDKKDLDRKFRSSSQLRFVESLRKRCILKTGSVSGTVTETVRRCRRIGLHREGAQNPIFAARALADSITFVRLPSNNKFKILEITRSDMRESIGYPGSHESFETHEWEPVSQWIKANQDLGDPDWEPVSQWIKANQDLGDPDCSATFCGFSLWTSSN